MLSEMKVLAEGNRWLKRMYVDNLMQNELQKEVLGKIGKALIAQGEVL